MRKRRIDIAVISDVHLGTHGCKADELIAYLSSIKPGKLILNGDIIDIWQFNKRYFPSSHLKVLKKLISMASDGTDIIYVTGNHDEMLRKFADVRIGNFHLVNKLVLDLEGKKAWQRHRRCLMYLFSMPNGLPNWVDTATAFSCISIV